METIFIQPGASFINDKRKAYQAQRETIARLAQEVKEIHDSCPKLKLMIGHGSGSFGHWAAKPYGTRQGVKSKTQWRGYAEVAAAAARLNRIVSDECQAAHVPALTIQPSASARCHDGQLQYIDTHPLHAALAHGLMPLIYGDVALDDVRGGTITSTEDLFLYLAPELQPSRILLLGQVAGVLQPDGSVIPQITPHNASDVRQILAGSAGVDVTGGMADKVNRMLELVRRVPKTTVHILSGAEPGLLPRAVLDASLDTGTRITAR